ncbi:lipocalin family protein [Aureibacter tunicatorum]|uniref:Major membrane immunogen (Membrane-anchored lipoprotein) n=1 Tax=Aureibacter tunicatorum TaxID=866807 RepID=A0AAE4BQ25_9BACT|nr:lipocalin family protein [Aureibacter tunicatorum]MDR6238644.1 major membrane immunogen (membrane-anchored lipoprotein) [Aureibacter tunicatorum]BDD05425.1 hypothetical protein AUTU_29080 [Aureibacter tunicatorum]
MLKLRSLFVFVLAVMLMSCSKDEDDNLSFSEDLLAGTWNTSAFNYAGSSYSVVNGVTSPKINYTGVGKNFDQVVVFESNPNNVSSEGDYEIELTSGTTADGLYEIESANFDGEWKIVNGNILEVTESGLTQQAHILELTEKMLKLHTEEIVEYEMGGATIHYTLEATIELTR